jgi:Putative DNA-binding domain
VNLEQLQELLARAISEPGSVEPDLLEASIAARAPLDARARASIYAEMYRFRLADALRADYPRLAHLLGDEGFLELATAYASVRPSTSSDIGQFGRHLAGFLAEHPGPRGDESDLARLEWALAEAFTALDAEPVTQEALGRLGEAAADATFFFVPSLQTLALGHDVLPLWEELDVSDEPPAMDAREVHVVVWRKGFQVLHRAMPAEEATALSRAQGGRSLAEVCEAFVESEDPQGDAFRTLGAWFSGGWVARVAGP